MTVRWTVRTRTGPSRSETHQPYPLRELKKKKTFPERLQDCEDEDLDLDDLMDIAGGEEPDSAKTCGLGCFLNGMNETPESQNSQNGQIEP